MSLGGLADSVVDSAVASLVAAGVTVVVAAGNDSRNACNYSPARVSAAITVGATTDADAQSSFSNYGSCIDIFAPGSGILGAGINSNSSSDTMSGTSMASPHVAGYAAVVLGLFGSSTAPLTPAQVTAAVVGTSTSNVLTGLGAGTVNKLLYVGAEQCSVAVAAGVTCSQSVAPAIPTSSTLAPILNVPSVAPANPPSSIAPIANAPTVQPGTSSPSVSPSSSAVLKGSVTAVGVAKFAKVKVPVGFKAVLSINRQANCRLSGGRLVVLKTGNCRVLIQLRSPGKASKNYNKTLKVKK